jgi:hypothetical protein
LNFMMKILVWMGVMLARNKITSIVTLVLVATLIIPSSLSGNFLHSAYADVTCNNQVTPPLCQVTGTLITVNNGPEDQLDPHIYGNTISYTNLAGSTTSVHYYNIATATDTTINNGGAFDYLSDTNGNTIIFTRLIPATSEIESYSVTTGTTTTLDPQAGSQRSFARVGGDTVVWQDFGLGNGAGSDALVAYSLTTGSVSTIYNDGKLNEDPEVSPDGTVVTWMNCNIDGTGCNVYDAIYSSSSSSWAVNQLTTDGEDSHPDTNGQVVVYSEDTTSASGVITSNIYIKPVTGGPAQEIALSGNQENPTISGNLIAFEGQNLSAPTVNTDIYVYDMNTGLVYQITNTPENETLNDIYLSNGVATVVWQVQSGPPTGWDIYAFTFNPQSYKLNCIPNNGGANLKGTDLSSCSLAGYNLSGDNLKGANLSGADLEGANLSGANLQGAILQNANLSGANLQGANLNGANLSGATLTGLPSQMTNFNGANMNKAILTGAICASPNYITATGANTASAVGVPANCIPPL